MGIDVDVFFMGTMTAQIVVMAVLFALGRRHVLGSADGEYRPVVTPKTALIIPLTGDDPSVRESLPTLLNQDYANVEVWFATSDEDDPAVPLVRTLQAKDARVRLVFSGYATKCSQKNHAILAALDHVSDDVEIYVFCDSSHRANRNFLGDLIAPIARGDADLSGGFHKVIPLDGKIGTIGMLITCMSLHLMQPIKLITQPWGGAMAMSREAFESHRIRALWSENIVDDFSLGPYLHTQKPKVVTWPVASACLETPIRGRSVAAWDDWLTRQLLYLKFCIPPGWIGATLAVWVLAASPVLGILSLVGYAFGLVSGHMAFFAAGYLACFMGLGFAFRTLSPRPVHALAWLRGYLATFLMLGWCFGRTFFTFDMRWRGITYKVGWGGKVREVIRGEGVRKQSGL